MTKHYILISPYNRAFGKIIIQNNKEFLKFQQDKYGKIISYSAWIEPMSGGLVIAKIYINKNKASKLAAFHEICGHLIFHFLRLSGVNNIKLNPWNAKTRIMEENFCSLMEFAASRADKIFKKLKNKRYTKNDYIFAKNHYKFKY